MAKSILAYACYCILIAVPVRWWKPLRLDGEVLAWAGHYGFRPSGIGDNPDSE